MKMYAAIDLHSNNSVVVVMDESERVVYRRRLANDLVAIVAALRSCAGTLVGTAVESTFNWYWLVDGLQDAGFKVHLVNTTAVKQYDGLKFSGDEADARQLAQLLRLGILPEGYIYPREERALRDLLRKRHQLVRQRTSQILSIELQLARNLNLSACGTQIKRWQPEAFDAMALLPEQRLALQANVRVMQCLNVEIHALEREIVTRAKLREDYQHLQSVSGIGKVLALTIALETGDIHRFAGPGNPSSAVRKPNSGFQAQGLTEESMG